jgi:hypothetical protein
MCCRSTALTSLALLLSLLASLAVAGDVHAHRLDADATVRVICKVQIDSWFSDDSRPKGAPVQVYRVADGELLTEGQLDDQGAFVFLAEAEPLRVVVDAGEGHRKELTVDLTQPMPVPERKTEVPVKEVLLGVGLLLAAAAFVLSLRNARQLRELSRRADSPKNRNAVELKVDPR